MADRSKHIVGGGLHSVAKELHDRLEAEGIAAKKAAWAEKQATQRAERLAVLQAEQKALIEPEKPVKVEKPKPVLKGTLAEQRAELARIQQERFLKSLQH